MSKIFKEMPDEVTECFFGLYIFLSAVRAVTIGYFSTAVKTILFGAQMMFQ